ncbi:putative ribonuclease H protein [Cardamine amara subsp. amara]|uniref:Ribonuclease H protein n=1 Tax=Cardamine amara subsp. amara TaxID=228776 RepID=A0ABD1C5F6_CARAN
MLDKAARERQFGYHPYCQNLKLMHLCFADDLLVFSGGKKQSIAGILQVFKDFAATSCLKISLEKSTLFMAGVSDGIKDDILECFPFDSDSLPVRYLGLPLLTKKMTVQDYTPLIEKIRSRISCWTARYLSFAGGLQLIASVVHSLTNFWISAFRLPRKCIEEIDQICASFLWSGL